MESRQPAGPVSTLQADPPEMVSVNSRGGASSGMSTKVGFFLLIFGLLFVAGLVGLNKWRAAKKEGDARVEVASKTENKPAQVGIRRTFDPDAPPPLPAAASAAAALKLGGSAQGSQATMCADGSPSIAAIGMDGGVIPAPGAESCASARTAG